MFFLRRHIWQTWTTFCHYLSFFSSRITGLFLPLISREQPKDDVENPSPQGEVERVSPLNNHLDFQLLKQVHLDHRALTNNYRYQRRRGPTDLYKN